MRWQQIIPVVVKYAVIGYLIYWIITNIMDMIKKRKKGERDEHDKTDKELPYLEQL